MAWSNDSQPHNTKAERRRILARDGHQCQIQGPGCLVDATEVDHIDNRRGPGYDLDENKQAVCWQCHKVKTQAEALRRRVFRREPRPSIGTVMKNRRS